MYNDYNSSPSLSNVTFSGNSADYGGGMSNGNNSSPTVTNSILWGNNPEQIYNDSLSSVTVTYSDIEGGYTGTGNLHADPLLGLLADNGGFTQTHALGAGSSAIDAGDPLNCPETDQRGFPRPFDGNGDGTATCDMGAYEYNSFSLTLDIVGSGSIDLDPDKLEYLWGEEVTLTATANPGWTFTGWGGDASGSDNPLTYTIVGNTTITATFTQNEYTLTVTPSGSGTVSVEPLQSTYHYGDEVSLTATANSGWTFSSWGGVASGSENPLTITIEGNTSITATFTQNEYTLTVAVTPIGSGTVSVEPLQSTYHYGDEVSLTATADPGWTFTGWGGDATGAENPLTITIEGNTSITAEFINFTIYLPLILR